MSEWYNIKDRQPTIPDPHDRVAYALVSEPLLFVVDGRTYTGRYHVNGCFYDDSRHMAARTVIAEAKYQLSQLPKAKAELWSPLPEPPEPQSPVSI